MTLLRRVVDSCMQKVSGIKGHCGRCLRTERWGGSVVLMVMDATFTSIGLNYFTAVVPKVEEFPRDKYERLDATVKEMNTPYHSASDFVNTQIDEVLEKYDKWQEEKTEHDKRQRKRG